MLRQMSITINDIDIAVDVAYSYDEPELDYFTGTGCTGGYEIDSVKYGETDITALVKAVGLDEMIMDDLVIYNENL